MSPGGSISRALTIAGSDSGAGAGIQADLKTFAALGVYGTTVVVAVTAQNTCQVTAIQELKVDLVLAQIDAVMSDIGADAAKTGMLFSAELVEAVAEAAQRHHLRNLVVDPVMISKAGAHLLQPDAMDMLRRRLLPLARVVTPNVPEAAALVGRDLKGPDDYRLAAREIRSMGPASVIIKGGHMAGEPRDLLLDGEGYVEMGGERVETCSDHGTGCTFSAAITAKLALGVDLRTAAREAKEYVTGALRAAPSLGAGHGPLDHFYMLR